MTTATVEHGPDGTLVTGTTRDDRDLIAALKAGGFKWSRNLDAWYLPRTWGEATRLQRVNALTATVDGLTVEIEDGPGMSAAERDAEKRERAAGRADRMEGLAEKREAEAEAAQTARRKISDHIPLGQPILVGHHSEGRHRRDLAKIDRLLGREVQASDDAERATEAAERAARVASGAESKVTIGNRIEQNEAALRGLERHGRGDSAAAERLADQIEFDKGKLAAMGGVGYSKDNVHKGDLVKVRGQWYPVIRANAKSISVPWWGGDADSKVTDTTPYREIQEHVALAGATREQVEGMIAGASAAFPGLRDRLVRIAATL